MFDTAGDFEIASELLIHRPQTHTPQPRLRRGQSLALALFFMSHTKTHMSSAARVTLQQRTQALAPWVTRTRSNMHGGGVSFPLPRNREELENDLKVFKSKESPAVAPDGTIQAQRDLDAKYKNAHTGGALQRGRCVSIHEFLAALQKVPFEEVLKIAQHHKTTPRRLVS